MKNKNTVRTDVQDDMISQLNSYVMQAQLYQKTRSKTPIRRNRKLGITKGTLIALAPLAAQTLAIPMANAQCSVGIVNTAFSQNTANCNRKIAVDIDGDGVDDIGLEFLAGATDSFVIATGLNPVTAFSAATIGTLSPSIPFVAANNVLSGAALGTVASGYDFNQFSGTNAFILSVNGAQGDFATPVGTTSTGYLAIRSGGSYGFLEIMIDHTTAGDRCLSIGDFGLETPANPNTVLVGDCATLPVELSTFNAVATESAIELNWETLSEFQNLGFEVQRSIDAKDFRKLAWVNGNGTSSEIHQYHLKDEKVIRNQTYYYRLKQVDLDGAVEYSSIINAKIDDKNALQLGALSPNPSSTEMRLPIQSAINTEATIQIFDNAGRLIKSIHQLVDKGASDLFFDLSDIEQGVYFARIDIADERIYRKISVIR